VAKDYTKNIVVTEPYRYDSEVSLRKLYLAIIMHEYPFDIVEHEYFVEFIKSLCSSFPIKCRVCWESKAEGLDPKHGNGKNAKARGNT
jgi:hypothetical protein